ncbi:Ku protein [Emcibacter sp. SYSU 3D8]|uniref:non-homologous end joining protein Ku n=1 Tax=Emcibacter sp. SYSU 3D8 TaxID=3133969 RepID=UPI0031FEA356
MATKPTRTPRSTAKAKAPSRRKAAATPREARPSGARPIWGGNLRLALVSVPVNLYPATKSGAQISFHQVHEPSGKRIRYEKVVPGIGPVDTDEIVKGYEVEKGQYVLIDPDEIDAIKLEAKKTLDLVQFVGQGEIDPIWFDRPYYVVADGELAEEAYNVMRDALRGSGKIGLGQFVMRNREYIAALKPCGHGMLLETLRFSDEVRSAAPFFAGIDDARPDKELLDLAKELIERKTAPFDSGQFKDKYSEAVRALIDAKIKNRKPVAIEEEAGNGGTVIDLVEALKRSVKNSGKPAAPATRRKKAS